MPNIVLNKIYLAEEPFISIQGEGKTINTFSWFIRFFGCNYRCDFCDSKYSYENKDTRTEYEIDDLVNKIIESKIKNVIFTGGEPTLYQSEIQKIIKSLEHLKYDGMYEIETNGSIPLSKEFLDFLLEVGYTQRFNTHLSKRIIFNISPKPDKSLTVLKDKINIAANLELLRMLNLNYILKFVYDHPDSVSPHIFVAHIFENLNFFKEYSHEKVYIMPECKTREEHLINFSEVLQFCQDLKFNFSPRLHILLWDNKKGV